MTSWDKLDHHKFTQLKYIRYRLIDVLDPPSLLFSPASFLLPLSCLLPCSPAFAFLPSFNHMYSSFFLCHLPQGPPSWLRIAPCSPLLMLSLWGDGCTWTGRSVMFEWMRQWEKMERTGLLYSSFHLWHKSCGSMG